MLCSLLSSTPLTTVCDANLISFVHFLFSSFCSNYFTSHRSHNVDGTQLNYFLWLKNFWWKYHILRLCACVCVWGGGDNSPVSVYSFSLLWALFGIDDPKSVLGLGLYKTKTEDMARVMYISSTVRNKIKALRTCWFFSSSSSYDVLPPLPMHSYENGVRNSIVYHTTVNYSAAQKILPIRIRFMNCKYRDRLTVEYIAVSCS